MSILHTYSRRTRSAWATLALVAATSMMTAEAAPVRWTFDNIETNTGATIHGSFTYDAELRTYSDIAVEGRKQGAITRYRAVRPPQDGRADIVRLVEEALPDLTGKPILLMTFGAPLSDAGGVVSVQPFPAGTSYQAVCALADCTAYSSPFDDVTGGQVTSARVWHLEGVATSSGKTLTGTFHYQSTGNVHSDFDLTLSGNGATTLLRRRHPDSGGLSTLMAVVEQEALDYTGQQLVFTQLASAMTDAGGTIDIVPRPGGFSFTGFCLNADCAQTVGGPVEDVISGRITTSNLSPELTSPAAVMVNENQTLAIDLDAQDDNDSEGEGLAYSLIGGSDLSLFTVDAVTGVVTFNTAPAFLMPTDHNQDNVYELQVAVTDLGQRTHVADVTVEVLGNAQIVASAASLHFGDVPWLGTAVDLPLEISNIGAAALIIGSVEITGNDDLLFEVIADGGCSAPVVPQATCTTTVRLTPSAIVPPGPVQALLTIASNDPELPTVEIPVSADLTLGTAQVPSSIDLGAVPVGTTVTQMVPITIDGPVRLDFLTIDDPDARFTVSTSCPVGELTTTSCTVDVSYRPETIGFALSAVTLEFGGPETAFFEFPVTAEGIVPVDSDNDGVLDFSDNCTLVANPDQRDTNGDGFGNACDADLNNDGTINVVDLGILRSTFFSADADADFNGDGVVNVVDLGMLRGSFFGAPGPAGLLIP